MKPFPNTDDITNIAIDFGDINIDTSDNPESLTRRDLSRHCCSDRT
jgi:hypothetical protein